APRRRVVHRQAVLGDERAGLALRAVQLGDRGRRTGAEHALVDILADAVAAGDQQVALAVARHAGLLVRRAVDAGHERRGSPRAAGRPDRLPDIAATGGAGAVRR